MNKIIFEIDDGVAILKLNHPQVLNAVGAEMLAELNEVALMLADPDSGARCLLVTGVGKGFCAGANLQERRGERRPGDSVLRDHYHPLLFKLRDLDMPIVTAVNGAAAGVGMSFAMLGDIVCATEEAYFLQAFARIGLIPDGGATFMLPRMIGWGRAVELSMLAERLPAQKAHEWGLVNRLYPDPEALWAGAREIAGRLAKGPRSLALIRKAYWNTWSNAFEQQLELEAKLQIEAGQTSDYREGVAAFLEKRPAKFSGS